MKDINLLLTELAEKLGTTIEYLWGVLIKQAYVYAITMTIADVFMIACIIATIKLHVKFSKDLNAGNDDLPRLTMYDKHEYILSGIMSCAGVLSIVFMLALVLSFSSIVTAYINPEYWALNKLLNSIK